MIRRIIDWMAGPKTRKEKIVLRILKIVAIVVGVAFIIAALKVGTRQP